MDGVCDFAFLSSSLVTEMLLVPGSHLKNNGLEWYFSTPAINYSPVEIFKNTDAGPVLTSESEFLWVGFRIDIL